MIHMIKLVESISVLLSANFLLTYAHRCPYRL